MRIGYKLATEAFGPKELIRQAVLAERAAFDFVEMSDHYHPWLEAQGHSAFTWNLLSAIAVKTERIGLATGVTCPSVRYHPAVIAQAAATLAIISDGRFTLGAGAGERLNEHVTGTGFPGCQVRHQRFREALEIIRLLWQGGYRSYQGKHLQLEDARVFDLPGELPPIAVAASGPASAKIAATSATGCSPPSPTAAWSAPGSGSAATARPTGWKVMAELPNPVNFQAAVASIGPQQVLEQFACGPDVKRHLQVARQYADAGFDHLVAMNTGPDPDGFMDFFARELAGPLRALTPSGAPPGNASPA